MDTRHWNQVSSLQRVHPDLFPYIPSRLSAQWFQADNGYIQTGVSVSMPMVNRSFQADNGYIQTMSAIGVTPGLTTFQAHDGYI